MNHKKAAQPQTALHATTYDQALAYAGAYAAGKINLLVMLGRPGTGKGRLLRAAVGRDALWLEGSASAFGLYCELYRQKPNLLVLDDLDGIYADPSWIRMLKTLCQTDNEKWLGWQSAASGLAKEGIPTRFCTTARVAIIANEWKSLNANVLAVEDRAIIVHFDPDALELHARVATWFWDQEVYDYIGRHLHLAVGPSMRSYVRAYELKRAGLDWQAAILSWWGVSAPTVEVARLRADPSFQSEEARALAFVAAGHGSRATYFRHAGKLRPTVAVPEVTLTTPPPEGEKTLLDSLGGRKGRDGRWRNN